MPAGHEGNYAISYLAFLRKGVWAFMGRVTTMTIAQFLQVMYAVAFRGFVVADSTEDRLH
jgi:hypothetical protein